MWNLLKGSVTKQEIVGKKKMSHTSDFLDEGKRQ